MSETWPSHNSDQCVHALAAQEQFAVQRWDRGIVAGMATAAKWSAALVAEGFQGSEELLGAMVRLLVANQFTGISNLKHADHPSEWDGAADVDNDGLDFLNSVRKRLRRGVRSRRDLLQVLHARACGSVAGPPSPLGRVGVSWPLWRAECFSR